MTAIVAGLGDAMAHEGPQSGLHEGFYVAPLYSLTFVDPERLTDDGDGYAAALGYRWAFASVELRAESLTLARNDGQGEAELTGYFVGAQVAPLQSLRVVRNLYGAVNFGAHERKNHPRFDEDDSTSLIEVGLGNHFPFELFGFGLAARVEGLYRLDTQQPPFPPNTPRKFEDWLLHAGLQVPLSRRPKPPEPPAPAPVAVVPSAIVDTDGDGVPDPKDQCPDTPAGSLVNNVGCTPEAPPAAPAPVTLETAKAGDVVVLHGVNFEFNRAELTSNARRLLDDVAQQLNARPELKIEVGGHTDGRGSDVYNQSLSERRAQSVQAYLSGQGVAAERLTAVGYGEAQPVDTNDTDEGRERNRRVELKVLE